MAQTPRNSISASPDDAAGRRQPPGNGGSRRRSGATPSRGIGLNLILAILVAGLVVAGWFLANQHELLKANQATMATAEKRLLILEDRLRVTDEAMTETGENTKEKLGYWESEIRKLWAVSNERNKGWIEQNQQGIKSVRQSIASLETTTRDLKAAVARNEQTLARQETLLAQIGQFEQQIGQIAATERELVDKVNSARQAVASLQAGLANRVGDNEQAIKAIDAYRLQLNNRLAQLEGRLGVAPGG